LMGWNTPPPPGGARRLHERVLAIYEARLRVRVDGRLAAPRPRRDCPEPTVSATAVAPPPPTPDRVFTTHVRNQRRRTSAVAGLCDRRRMGHLLGYARVSTADQQPHLQVDALERAGCYRVFTETASGVVTARRVLERSGMRAVHQEACSDGSPGGCVVVTPGQGGRAGRSPSRCRVVPSAIG
jgi:hypothetical protein